MAVRNPDTTGRVTRTESVDLAQFTDVVPEGTMVDVTVRGTPDSHTIELERHGLRYLVEASGHTAELTGVFGDGNPSTPRRVPEWIEPVLAAVADVHEVSVYR